RRPVRIRSHREDTALAEQSLTAFVRYCDATEFAAGDTGDTGVASQPLVQKRIVRAQEVQNAAVLMQHALKEKFSFLGERHAEVFVKIGKRCGVGQYRLDIAQV